MVETFASVGTSDPAWTEKVCAMAMANDGSLQIGFGLGKYTNRNIMDGYAALSRGVEQLTVRASRRLSPLPDVTAVGPIHYEVVKPLQAVRFRLDANEAQPLAFDWLFEGIVPPFTEERTHLMRDYRVMSELVRYHQIGTASGWIELDGTALYHDARHLDLDPRSLLGRALRRRHPARGCGTERGHSRRRRVHDDLVPAAHDPQ